ncbi:allophanate hydrolase [Aquabacterium sp. J223]|uniref:allophanate hydrolase n=1 Tax=Aquabacterium sp. J223 TaxID=2898431 RepID=UPI0021AD7589|nr:allophanate hydrolase [Aquabacterium sp. J223]UUX96977.1 allophanate hydrolase [Aquabacterium sp. J223]
MTPLRPLTLADWRAAYAAGARPASLLADRLASLRLHSPREAWIHLATDAELATQLQALAARADGLDAAARAAALPLYGVPFAVKDNIHIEGVVTTAACPAFAEVAPRTAAAVQKLVDAGAVWLGKTNLDQFATGLVGARSPYGRPSSTFDATRVSGGSSSGSAVVVARGDVPFALGTDTAGSGRVPAGFNNLVGVKPTPGRVSTAGVVPACRSLDCVSIFALTVADGAELLALMEGDDAADPFTGDVPAGPARWPQRLTLGVPREVLLTGPGYDAAWGRACAQAEALGHRLLPLDFTPLYDVAALLYDGPWVAERHAVVQPLLDERPETLDPAVRAVVAQAARFSATDAFRGRYRLQALARQAATLWQQVDALLVPTAPAHPTHAEVDADPLGANAQLGRWTNFVNLLGWCALALPAGFNEAELPFGITVIGPGGHDAALARFGSTWQAALALPLGATGRACDATVPARWPQAAPTMPIAVVGAHLAGLPLNGQLIERGATLAEATTTAPHYRLYALPGTVPPKPGLQLVADGGAAVAVEVWDMPVDAVGSFLALIPPPLGLGSLQLADGRWVHGFVCEAHALAGAEDITRHGGWRAYLAARSAAA